MKHENTMSRGDYLFRNLWWTVVIIIWYKMIFRRMEGFTNAQSLIILACIIVASLSVGAVLTIERGCNLKNLAVNVALPLGIYTFVSYGELIGIWIGLTLAAVGGVAAWHLYPWIRTTHENAAAEKAPPKKHLVKCFFAARTACAFCMGMIMLVLFVNSMFGYPLFDFTLKQPGFAEYTINDNIEELSKLDEDTWESLSEEEKAELLHLVKNIEISYLGIPHEILIEFEELSDVIAAHYNDHTRTVTVSLDYFESASAEDMLHTLCHEIYHAYQHRLCDAYDSVGDEYRGMLIFGDVEEYMYELSHYISGEDDLDGYSDQALERDADSYADECVGDYYRKIYAYLQKTQSEK